MDTEFHRPQYHFTPPSGWMNDPNGLVYHAGEYHLFYQYLWPRHWGHAVSDDLVQWKHLPVALAPDDLGGIWSGSAVVDERDTSGFFGGGGGLVAVFTHQRETPDGATQSQSLAYSADNGRTWTKYAGNPVLVSPNPDFRDPKVFWHTDTQRWVMVLATGESLSFYVSPNLRDWDFASEIILRDKEGRGCECPDLFPLDVDGDSARRKWVLHWSWVDMSVFRGRPGREMPRESQGMRYLVGDFDGRAFTPDAGPPLGRPSACGKDDYAAVTWFPEPQGRCLMLGWMNQWVYSDKPVAALTLPRELRLKTVDGEARLVQSPVRELESLRRDRLSWSDLTLSPDDGPLVLPAAEVFELIAEVEPGADGEFGFHIRRRGEQRTTIGYDAGGEQVFVDRRFSGKTDFSAVFPLRHDAPLPVREGRVCLHIFVDRESVEVFANDGEAYFSDLIFPEPGSDGLELYVRGGAVKVHKMELFTLA